MLTRSTQVGEFYVVRAPSSKPPEGSFGFMDITLYDEEKDSLVRIPYEDIRKAAMSYKTGGADPTLEGGSKKLSEWVASTLALMNASKAGKFADEDAYANNKWAVIVIARPFLEHLMHSAVLCVAGRDTGATLFGPAGECAEKTIPLRALSARGPSPDSVFPSRDPASPSRPQTCRSAPTRR